MENNNNLNQPIQPVQPVYQQPVQPVQPVYQQPVYQQPVQPVQPQPVYQQPVQPIMNQQTQVADPNYAQNSKKFLGSGIADLVASFFPIASIVGMVKAKKNRKALLEYVAQGNPLTGKLKTASALLRAAFYTGLGFTIFYGVYIAWIAIAVTAAIMDSM